MEVGVIGAAMGTATGMDGTANGGLVGFAAYAVAVAVTARLTVTS